MSLPEPPPDDSTPTRWLQQLDASDGAAVDVLYAALYDELRQCALAQLRRETDCHTLSATALAHEAWFRMVAQTRTRWASRSHFLGVASIMMRRILVNHALARRAAKRDAQLVSLTLSEAQQVAGGPGADVVAVHEALLALAEADARAARVVELKFFGGLEVDEIAQVLGVGSATVKRDWAFARAWLFRALGGTAAGCD